MKCQDDSTNAVNSSRHVMGRNSEYLLSSTAVAVFSDYMSWIGSVGGFAVHV
jgi:hypothetical protein